MPAPKLKKPPLVEVVLELKFQNEWENFDYSIELSKLASAILPDYPLLNSLPTAQLPPRFPEGLVRHRFSSKDQKHLVNFGEFLISINTLAYETIEPFMLEIKKVLEYHSKIGNKKVIRKGLRYINRINLEKGLTLDDIFSSKISHPPYIAKNCIGINHAYLADFKDGLESIRIVQNPKETFCFLDIDFYNSEIVDYDVKNILTWLNVAYAHISETFISTLNQKFYASLK